MTTFPLLFLMCYHPAGHFKICHSLRLFLFFNPDPLYCKFLGISFCQHPSLVPGSLVKDPEIRLWGKLYCSIQLKSWNNFFSFWKVQIGEAKILPMTTNSSVTRVRNLSEDPAFVWSHSALPETATEELSWGIMTPGCPGLLLNFNPWATFSLYNIKLSFLYSTRISEDLRNMCV